MSIVENMFRYEIEAFQLSNYLFGSLSSYGKNILFFAVCVSFGWLCETSNDLKPQPLLDRYTQVRCLRKRSSLIHPGPQPDSHRHYHTLFDIAWGDFCIPTDKNAKHNIGDKKSV